MASRLAVLLVSLLLATPAVMFWLWLVIVGERVVLLCPKGCECDTEQHKVTCVGSSVTAVPLIRSTDVREFGLYYNDFKLIERDSFVSLTELEVLSVEQCGLRTIELGAFNGLRKLTNLSIQGNEISEIIPGTF
jgi:hypothetical protein